MATQTTTTTTTTEASTNVSGFTSALKPAGGRDVRSSMNYLDDSVHLEPPLVLNDQMTPIPDHPLKSYPVIVRDLRGKEDQFSLDKNGFMFMKHKSAVRPEDMSDTEKTTPIYTAECEEILKKVTGASRVVCYHHTARFGPVQTKLFNTGPSEKVHVDSSMAFAEQSIKRKLGDDVVNKRWANVNVWRPIKTIKKSPFALMDCASVREEDLRARSYRHESIPTSETAFPVYHPDQRWWYQSLMQPDEIMIFKIADPDHSRAWFVPHSSFRDEEFADEPDRESLETRTYLVWD